MKWNSLELCSAYAYAYKYCFRTECVLVFMFTTQLTWLYIDDCCLSKITLKLVCWEKLALLDVFLDFFVFLTFNILSKYSKHCCKLINHNFKSFEGIFTTTVFCLAFLITWYLKKWKHLVIPKVVLNTSRPLSLEEIRENDPFSSQTDHHVKR